MRVFNPMSLPLPVYAADGEPPAGAPPKDPPAGDPPAGDPPKDPPAADPPKTGLDAAADGDPPAGDPPKPQTFPDDWRDQMAGADKDLRKRLDRFKSPVDVTKSFAELEKLKSAGKLKGGGEAPDGTKDPDGLKAWRAENGIPEDPTGYALPDEVTKKLTDADKPILASFTEFAHERNLPPRAVEVAAEWYTTLMDAQAADRVAADNTAAEAVQDELRSEWGAEFRGNSNLAKRFAETITPGVNWLEARAADGRRLGDIPDFVKAMAELGRKEYGDVQFAGGENTTKTMARKAELEQMMKNDMSSYRANPALAKEYESIMDAELKAGKRK